MRAVENDNTLPPKPKMLIAEIRHKLAEFEDIAAKEDVLTADVFGVLKYLPRDPYLRAVFEVLAARNPEAKEFRRHLPKLSSAIAELKFDFWPKHVTPPEFEAGSTEPDLQLTGPDTLIIFEAKLRSGFGEKQVERELAVALDQAGNREAFVVLVTLSSRPPLFKHRGRRLRIGDYLKATALVDSLDASVANLLHNNSSRILWISWDTIIKTLTDTAKADSHINAGFREMVADLEMLAVLRGIIPFAGIGNALEPAAGPMQWTPFVRRSISIGRCCASASLELLSLKWSVPRHLERWSK